jgi:IS605 OrfB family transposase
MKLVINRIVKSSNIYFKEIDDLCFASKNLYNSANYLIRQEYINNKKYLNYYEIYKLLKTSDQYKALPSKAAQANLRLLDKSWKCYFEAIKSYYKNPIKFTGKPKLPGYKDSLKGRNLVVFNYQAISKSILLKNKVIKLSCLNILIPTTLKYESICEVRIVPKLNHYKIEIVYNSDPIDLNLDKIRVASIDLGLNNLVTIGFNTKDVKPLIINGRPLKSINQFFNKTRAKFQSTIKNKSSKRIQNLTNKRNNKVQDYLHKSSRIIINQLIHNNIGLLIIGKNEGWKENINIGKKNNQNFVSIPHCTFINQLIYKAQLVGIEVILQEESYTSKASFIDQDNIPTYKKGTKHTFSGKRIKRGLYKSKESIFINADLNGAYNILRKAVPNSFEDGIEGFVVNPIRLKIL